MRKHLLVSVYEFAGGLSEFWALAFGASGIVLAFRGHLDGNFAALITAVLSILTAHDALDEYHERKSANGNPNPNPEGTGNLQTQP